MSYTPGPWKLSARMKHHGKQFVIETTCKIEGAGPAARRVAQVQNSVGLGDPLANAVLIAAAPDLLKLAEEFKAAVIYQQLKAKSVGDKEGANMMEFTINNIRAVIATARGTS